MKTADAGSYLTMGGDQSGGLIAVIRGSIALTSTVGNTATPIMHFASGVIWIGYRPLVMGATRVVTAQARTRVSYAEFPLRSVRAMLLENPQWWEQFAILQAFYGDITAQIASDLLIRDSGRRLAAILLRFAGVGMPMDDMKPEHSIPITQQELALSANLSRNVTGTFLKSFERQGWIKRKYGQIVVCQHKQFLEYAADV